MEKVQLSLERFLPELRDLKRKNLFNTEELNEIVTKRKAFEVELSSKLLNPIQFILYINYEKALEQLRAMRAKRSQATTKKTISDHSISAHINQLYQNSTSRFPGSFLLWDASIAHSLTQASPLLVSKTLSKVIALHPTLPKYWILASQFESEGTRNGLGGGNVEGARRLCMRALRFLKGGSSKESEMLLWKEWIRLEVAFAEKLRARLEILGIGSTAAVTTEDASIDVPLLPNESTDAPEVIKEALSGTDALIGGAVVHVVLDNALSSFNHTLESHQILIQQVRSIGSTLRLPLLAHLYASLQSNFTSESTNYAQVVHTLSTTSLYDVEYDPKVKTTIALDSNGTTVDEDEIKVDGEDLVDSIGQVVESYWKVLKGKKGKSSAIIRVEIWETFCEWLESMINEADDEDLIAFLNGNLTLALSMAPSSVTLSLLHLRHLLRLDTPDAALLAFTESMMTSLNKTTTIESREELWVARLEVVAALSPDNDDDDEKDELFRAALKAIPFSGRIWNDFAEYMEGRGRKEVEEWYETSIRSILSLSSSLPPPNFVSKFDTPSPRTLLPPRYLNYLIESNSTTLLIDRIISLIKNTTSLPISFLEYILSLPLSSTTAPGIDTFRSELFEAIVHHRLATVGHYVNFAEDLVKRGDVAGSNKIIVRARAVAKLNGRNGESELELTWSRVCAKFE